MTETNGTTDAKVTTLNSLLRGELSAIETYDIALRNVGGDHASAAAQLRAISADHATHADVLRTEIRSLGGTPSSDSGAWGAYAQAVEGSAALFGSTAAIKALKEGEEHGLKEYSSAIKSDDLDDKTRTTIASKMVPNQQRHISTLDSILSAS